MALALWASLAAAGGGTRAAAALACAYLVVRAFPGLLGQSADAKAAPAAPDAKAPDAGPLKSSAAGDSTGSTADGGRVTAGGRVEDDGESHRARREGPAAESPGVGLHVECSVAGARLVADGTPLRFSNAAFEGVVRLNVLGGLEDVCSVSLRGRLVQSGGAPQQLWFGVELVDASQFENTSRAVKSLVAALLSVVKRFMRCDARYDLEKAPSIAFDAAVAGERFDVCDEAPNEAAPLSTDGAESAAEQALSSQRVAAGDDIGDKLFGGLPAGSKSRVLSLSWYTRYVDFNKWKVTQLPRLLFNDVPLDSLWGDSAMRLVLFSGAPGKLERTYYLSVEIAQKRAAAPVAEPVAPVQVPAAKRRAFDDEVPVSVAAVLDDDAAPLCYVAAGGPDISTPGQFVRLLDPATVVSAVVAEAGAAADGARLGAAEAKRQQLEAALRRGAGFDFRANDAAQRLFRSSSTVSELFNPFNEYAFHQKEPGLACLVGVWGGGWVLGRLRMLRDLTVGDGDDDDDDDADDLPAACPSQLSFSPVRGGALFAALRLGQRSATLALPLTCVEGVRSVAPPAPFGLMGCVEVETASRCWTFIFTSRVKAEDWAAAAAQRLAFAQRRVLDVASVEPAFERRRRLRLTYACAAEASHQKVGAVHQFLPTGRVVLNRRRAAPAEGEPPCTAADAPGRALEMLLTATPADGSLALALDAAAGLQFLDHDALRRLPEAAAVAFSLNLYHLIIAHAQLDGVLLAARGDASGRAPASPAASGALPPRREAVAPEARTSLLALASVLNRASYVVAECACSAYEMEHGVLRRKCAQPDSILSALLLPDRRCALGLAPPQASYAARLDLALHAGVTGCGPARVPRYTADKLDAQLDAAASAHAAAAFAQSADDFVLPSVCKWYGNDFAPNGDARAVAAAVARFLPEGDRKRASALLAKPGTVVRYAAFDTHAASLVLLDA